ncbi:MBF transcription factor activator Rep1 [Schizosaccharomyces pombe]|uniref:Transcriptional activator protein rec16 n=1 Tax=Schizosaccharomyces pombe (strain 972 / ATCC 24843) TaxID=284812 RepID=REC16_SCHPO|nr:MBF transcription factor complex subunit Rep1 [Schizosaccharomyces pombe]P40379.1 RecName: Full=Transcriptional activator protein rec16; AltName: Full=Zinc finger protein rep1 [Schizosaccharomyces pombe 972h-]CAA21164.1 MBF transcription factor complex subunit Rep1 [Schizosaccharomyces pombe]CAA54653.1 repl+ [Schizosaccharomyces pombe]|eukprot:NP_596225.1 MBF transcription factor complex subunit Rep1 [Schizosaccharomyces pombe]
MDSDRCLTDEISLNTLSSTFASDNNLRRKENFLKSRYPSKFDLNVSMLTKSDDVGKTPFSIFDSPSNPGFSRSHQMCSDKNKSPFLFDKIRDEPVSVDPVKLIINNRNKRKINRQKSRLQGLYRSDANGLQPLNSENVKMKKSTALSLTSSPLNSWKTDFKTPPKANVVCISLVIEGDGCASLLYEDLNQISNSCPEVAPNRQNALFSDETLTTMFYSGVTEDEGSCNNLLQSSFGDDLDLGMQRSATWAPGYNYPSKFDSIPFASASPKIKAAFPFDPNVYALNTNDGPVTSTDNNCDQLNTRMQAWNNGFNYSNLNGDIQYPAVTPKFFQQEGRALNVSDCNFGNEEIAYGGIPMRVCHSDSTLCDARIAAKQALKGKRQYDTSTSKAELSTPPSKRRHIDDADLVFHSSPLLSRSRFICCYCTKPFLSISKLQEHESSCSHVERLFGFAPNRLYDDGDGFLGSSFCSDW